MRPTSQILEDLNTLEDAFARNEQWRYKVVLPRLLGDLGDEMVEAFATRPMETIKTYQLLLSGTALDTNK